MTIKHTTKTAETAIPTADEIRTACQIHTLAQMVYGRLATSSPWTAPAPWSAPLGAPWPATLPAHAYTPAPPTGFFH